MRPIQEYRKEESKKNRKSNYFIWQNGNITASHPVLSREASEKPEKNEQGKSGPGISVYRTGRVELDTIVIKRKPTWKNGPTTFRPRTGMQEEDWADYFGMFYEV